MDAALPPGVTMGLFGFGGPKVQRIRPHDARAAMEAGAQLIDVRNRREYKAGHAAGARNIPVNTLPNVLHTLDVERPVICICASGVRAGRAGQLLIRNGFREVHNLGGTGTWAAAGLPLENES